MVSGPRPSLCPAAPRRYIAHTHAALTWQLTSWGNLNYYDGEGGKEIDSIPLGGCTIFVPNSRRADYPHAFRLNLDVGSGEKHKYILSGTSEIDSRDWQQSILRFAPLPSSKDASGNDKPAGKRSTLSNMSHGRSSRTVGTARGHAHSRTGTCCPQCTAGCTARHAARPHLFFRAGPNRGASSSGRSPSRRAPWARRPRCRSR